MSTRSRSRFLKNTVIIRLVTNCKLWKNVGPTILFAAVTQLLRSREFQLHCSQLHEHSVFFSVLNFLTVFFLKQKTSYTCTVMWTIFFSWKTSIEWIKFTRTVISILYLIIFYLILLHAQIIMQTVVFIGWILYVMEL